MGIRIGYLTDIHLRKEVSGTSPIKIRHCREMAELLPDALTRICRKSPNMIACTGDVVDVPTGPGVIQDLRFCKELFDDCAIPYLVLPGNHDPLPDDFYRVFPRPQKTVMLNMCHLISFHEDACFNSEQSSRRSDQSLRAMDDLLIWANCRPEVTLLFQHYVVYPNHNNGYPHNYQNDGEIRSILERSDQTILSISGHYLPGIALTQKNGVSYFAGRAFCEVPYTCYIINASKNGIFIEELEIGKVTQ